MEPEFVDRERELAWLEERFRSGDAELLVNSSPSSNSLRCMGTPPAAAHTRTASSKP